NGCYFAFWRRQTNHTEGETKIKVSLPLKTESNDSEYLRKSRDEILLATNGSEKQEAIG
ncbi:13364_t:CDS:2, partial [Funneliformis geosporum]